MVDRCYDRATKGDVAEARNAATQGHNGDPPEHVAVQRCMLC